jgi:membrane protease YdiL (CAAX protease family)
VIALFYPLKTGLAALIDAAQGGWGMAPEGVTRLLDQPLLIAPTLVFWLLFGPLPEEPGWRGYALDGLQARHSALGGSLIVGVVWMAWHLPLFFIDGTWQAERLGVGTLLFWLWMINVIVESVLYTWIYNNTGRSILAAILFHFVGNAFGELFAISPQAEIYSTGLSVAAVLLVIAFWGAATLRGGPRQGDRALR